VLLRAADCSPVCEELKNIKPIITSHNAVSTIRNKIILLLFCSFIYYYYTIILPRGQPVFRWFF